MYSFSKGQLPQSLQCLFTQNADVHQHNTRHHKDPHVVSRTSSVVSKSLVHAAPKIWFELPANIKLVKQRNLLNTN